MQLRGLVITATIFNQGAHTIAGGLKSEQRLSPPSPLTLTTARLSALSTSGDG